MKLGILSIPGSLLLNCIVLVSFSYASVSDSEKFIPSGIIQAGFSILGILFSCYLGYRYGLKKSEQQKRIEFIEKQVCELYSPMVGIYKDLHAKSKIVNKINNISDGEWRKLVKDMSPEVFRNSTDVTNWREKRDIGIEYNNNQLRNYIIPAYKKMQDILHNKIWLAEPDTLKWFETFNHFIDIWDRYLADYLQPEVLEKVMVSEIELQSFFEELENRLNFLRDKLKRGRPD